MEARWGGLALPASFSKITPFDFWRSIPGPGWGVFLASRRHSPLEGSLLPVSRVVRVSSPAGREAAPVPAPASAPGVPPRVGFSYSPLSLSWPGQQGPGGRGSRLPSLATVAAAPPLVPSRPVRSLRRVRPPALPPLGLRPVRAPGEPEGGRTVSGLGSGSGSARLRCRPRLLPGLRAALRAPPPPPPARPPPPPPLGAG